MRPEHMRLRKPGIPVEIEMVEVLGSEQLIHGRIGDTQVVVRCPVSLTKDQPVNVGDAFQIGSDGVHPLHWFDADTGRSEEHTSELQSLMRISYAVFCLQKKNTLHRRKPTTRHHQTISKPQ